MIPFETFLLGALIISTVTGLVTEALKKVLIEHKWNYHANTLAGAVAIVLSTAAGVGYITITGVGFTKQMIVQLVLLVFISWLCSMVGYDKVVQAIKQFKMDGKDDKNE